MSYLKFIKRYIQVSFYIAMFISAHGVLAQAPLWKWARGVTATYTGEIPGYGVSVDGACNAYVVGYFDYSEPYFGIGDTLHGAINPFIVKYDSSGNALWAKTVVALRDSNAGNSEGDMFLCDAVDKHGNVYVAGTSCSKAIIVGSDTIRIDGWSYTSPADSNRTRIFIMKYNPLGDVIWCKTIVHKPGNPSQLLEYGVKMVADVNEGFVLTGNIAANDPSYYLIFGSDTIYTNTSFGSNAGFVAKFDSAGNAMWGQPYGGLGIAEDQSGNVFVTSDYRSLTTYKIIGTDTLYGRCQILTDTGYNVSYIAKLNPTGTIIKAVNCGAIYYEQTGFYPFFPGFVRGLATDKTGNIYLSSDYTDSLFIGTDTLISKIDSVGFHSFFLAKYDNNLNFKWATSDTNVDLGYVTDITCDTLEGVYVGGILKGFNAGINATSPIVKFDSAGNHIWSKSGYLALCNDISLDNAGNAFITGGISDMFLPCNFDGDTVVSTSTSTFGQFSGYFAAKLGSNYLLNINKVNNSNNSVFVYPNPTSSNFNLKVDPDLIGENYFVADLLGKTILKGRIIDETTKLYFDNIPPGVYLLRISNVTLKMVKL